MKANLQTPAARESSGPRSLERLLALFDVLSTAPNGSSLAELSTLLGSPKSSLLNLLRPLVSEGFLVHDETRTVSAPPSSAWPLACCTPGICRA
jgi:hypothetical protein